MSAVHATSSRSCGVSEELKKKGEHAFDITHKLTTFVSSFSSCISILGFSKAKAFSTNIVPVLNAFTAIDTLKDASWLRSGKRKSWQQTTATAIGTIQSVMSLAEPSLKKYGFSLLKIGNIPVISLAINFSKLVTIPLKIWHSITVLRGSDKESQKTLEKIEVIRFKIRTKIYFEDENQASLKIALEREVRILKDKKTDAKLAIVASINSLAITILTLMVLSTGGAAALAASAPILILSLYSQAFGLCVFFYQSYRREEKSSMTADDQLISEQFKRISANTM